MLPNDSPHNLHFAFRSFFCFLIPTVFVTNVPMTLSLLSVPTGSVSVSSASSVSTGSGFMFMVLWSFSTSFFGFTRGLLFGRAITGLVWKILVLLLLIIVACALNTIGEGPLGWGHILLCFCGHSSASSSALLCIIDV